MWTDFIDSRSDSTLLLQSQQSLASMWAEIGGCGRVTIRNTVKDAFDFVNTSFTGSIVAVTGNMYVAGAVRYLLEVG